MLGWRWGVCSRVPDCGPYDDWRWGVPFDDGGRVNPFVSTDEERKTEGGGPIALMRGDWVCMSGASFRFERVKGELGGGEP